jgi:hypothetical protein
MDTNQIKQNKRLYDKERNRFMALRYASETDKYASINATRLAKELGFSKATISNMEDPNADEDTLLGKSARLFKAYHDRFGCSYEYLFGECSLPDSKYIGLNASPLASLDSLTLNNLEKLLSDKEFGYFGEYMFKAIMTEPEALKGLLNIVFRFMYAINCIQNNNSLNHAEKELAATKYWFQLNSKIDEYLKDSLLPHLQVGFDLFEEKEKERDALEIKQMEEDLEQYTASMSSPITIKILDEENNDKKTNNP